MMSIYKQNFIGIYKPTDHGIIVSRLEIIEPYLGVVVIGTVSVWVYSGYAYSGGVGVYTVSSAFSIQNYFYRVNILLKRDSRRRNSPSALVF